MTKRELAAALAERNNLSKKDAVDIVNSFVDIITEALQNGDTVQLTGFGTFALRTDQRESDITQEKTKIVIPARKAHFQSWQIPEDSVTNNIIEGTQSPRNAGFNYNFSLILAALPLSRR